MSNFFKRTQNDDYDHFQAGALSKELRQSINTEDRIISPKDFLINFSRFLAIFIIVFSIALTGYWLLRENNNSAVETAVPTVTASQQEAATGGSGETTGVIVGDSQSTGNAVTTDESSIVATGSNLAEITLWMSVVALMFFTCLATAGHRLLHNLLNF